MSTDENVEKRNIENTSNARLKTRLALSRTNRVSEVSANYLFKENMLFTSCSVIPIFSRLLNISHRPRIELLILEHF